MSRPDTFIRYATWQYRPAKWWWLRWCGGYCVFELPTEIMLSMDEEEFYSEYCKEMMLDSKLRAAVDWLEERSKDGSVHVESGISLGHVGAYFKNATTAMMFKLKFC